MTEPLRMCNFCCTFAALVVFGIYTDEHLLVSKRFYQDRLLVKVGGLFSDFYHPHFYFDYQVLGVPFKQSFPLTPWGPRKCQFVGRGETTANSKERALSALHVRFDEVGLCRGSQVSHCGTIP